MFSELLDGVAGEDERGVTGFIGQDFAVSARREWLSMATCRYSHPFAVPLRSVAVDAVAHPLEPRQLLDSDRDNLAKGVAFVAVGFGRRQPAIDFLSS